MPSDSVWSFPFADLRDDKQFFIDHPGAVPITTAQVEYKHPVCVYYFALLFLFFPKTFQLFGLKLLFL